MSTSRVLFEVDGPLAFLTFNRPEARNAMTTEMYNALTAACDRVDAAAAAATGTVPRVLVLRAPEEPGEYRLYVLAGRFADSARVVVTEPPLPE